MDHRCSLEFAPTASAILLAQAFNLSDGMVNGDRFNISDFADDLEILGHTTEYKSRHHTCQAGRCKGAFQVGGRTIGGRMRSAPTATRCVGADGVRPKTVRSRW